MTDQEAKLAAARRVLERSQAAGHQTGSAAERQYFYSVVRLVAQLERDLEGEVAPA